MPKENLVQDSLEKRWQWQNGMFDIISHDIHISFIMLTLELAIEAFYESSHLLSNDFISLSFIYKYWKYKN